MPEISPKEWKFIGITIIIVVSISCFPIIAGLIAKPANSVFLGFQFINRVDTPVYYSWIEQAKDGHILFKNLFTSENEPRFIFDPFWLGVGLFGKIFNLSSFAAYQLARIFLIPILLGLTYIFAAYFIKEENRRKTCFLLLIFSSGLGWATWLIAKIFSLNLSILPMDLWTPEAFTFATIYNSPHFIASLILLLLVFLLMLMASESGKFFYSITAGLSALILFQFHPYHILTIFMVTGIYYLSLCLRDRKIKWNLAGHFAVLAFLSSPAIFYHLWTLSNFWTRQQFAIQNNCFTPGPLVMLLSYGFIFVLACVGIYHLSLKRKDDRELFLFVWPLVHLALIYLPLNFQRRLTAGLHVSLSILAVYGFYHLKNKNFFLFRKKFLNIFFFITLLTFSNYFLLINDLTYYTNPPETYSSYITKNESEAMSWLRHNTPAESIIFSLPSHGNLIPALSLRATYLGQWGMTAQAGYKTSEIVRFFKNYHGKIRATFLKNNKINYIFYGSQERAFGNFNPEQADYLEKVYQNEEVAIYKVAQD